MEATGALPSVEYCTKVFATRLLQALMDAQLLLWTVSLKVRTPSNFEGMNKGRRGRCG